jgi:hypothetical protein
MEKSKHVQHTIFLNHLNIEMLSRFSDSSLLFFPFVVCNKRVVLAEEFLNVAIAA